MTIAEAPQTGLECKLYMNKVTHATPTWTEITKAIDVSANLGKNEATQGSRASGWQFSRGALKTLEITFSYRHKAGTDTVFDDLAAAFVAGTIYEYVVLDDAVTDTGAQGPRAFCEIMSMELTQSLEDFEEYSFTLKPAYKEESSALVNPDWYEVT